MSYIDTAIAEAVAASDAQEAKTETVETEVTTQEVTEPEGQTESEETTEQTTEDEKFPKKAVNALARKDKKITKVASERDYWKQRALEYERQKSTPEPKEEDFEGQPYGNYLKAVAKDEARKTNIEQALDAANTKATELETELAETSRAALDESGANAEKTFPDFRQVIESIAAQSPNGKLEFSQPAWDAIQRSDDGAAAIYSIAKENKLGLLNSLPPIEAAMMIKEHEIKAQSLPKIKHVSTAPEPITSARGVASGSKSLENMNSKELLALVR